MAEEQKVDIDAKAVGYDNQSTVKLLTKYQDAGGKTQTNENDIPQVGLGTWNSPPNKVEQAVEYALKIGYKHIDCAHCYGNEHEVGNALSKCFADGIAKRDEVFVTSKLWNTDHHPDDVPGAMAETLKNLQLQYVDLYLIHWPYNFRRTRAEVDADRAKLDSTASDYGDQMSGLSRKQRFPKNKDGSVQYGDFVSIMDTWRAMEKLVVCGQAKHIGLSNFNAEQVKLVLKEGSIKPVMLQCECHPYLSQSELVKLCLDNGMQFTCYSPLGSPARPNQNHYYPILMEDALVKTLAAKWKGKTPANVLIRYAVERGTVVIPKSVTPSRIKANLEVFDMELGKDAMQEMLKLNRDMRYCAPTAQLGDGSVVYRDRSHPSFPFQGETVITEKDFK